MTDYQILTIIAAFIIVDIAVLSLVAIPLLRRRLAARMDNHAPADLPPPGMRGDPLVTASADRLAAAIGSRPTLSATVPTADESAGGAAERDNLPIAASRGDIDENEGSDMAAPDVIDSIAAVRSATGVGQVPSSVTTHSDDARDEAEHMDPTEMSLARARGFAIHPEDPLVASTIDRLLGARREADHAVGTHEAAAAGEGASAAAADASATTAANGTGGVHIGDEAHATGPAGEPAGAEAAAAGSDNASVAAATGVPTALGRPVMATGTYTSEGVLEPTIDPATGLDSALTWATAITIEEARSGRYGRPVSVVIAELDGLDRLAELFGADVADKLIPPVADALRRSARAADRVARLSHTRFGVLLVETDEIRAINYVERVRSACDSWLEASAIALRLSIGWASPATDGDLRSAVRIAEDRMHREQHRPAPWRPAAVPSAAGSNQATTEG